MEPFSVHLNMQILLGFLFKMIATEAMLWSLVFASIWPTLIRSPLIYAFSHVSSLSTRLAHCQLRCTSNCCQKSAATTTTKTTTEASLPRYCNNNKNENMLRTLTTFQLDAIIVEGERGGGEGIHYNCSMSVCVSVCRISLLL